MKKTILLDVDGVIANFRKLYVDLCNELNGTEFTDTDTGNGWEFARELGLTQKQMRDVWALIAQPGRAGRMALLPGAKEAVRSLLDRAHVYFVTSPVPSSPTWTYDRNAWLSTHFRVKAEDYVVYTSQKHLVQGDIFVDDKPEAVFSWVQKNNGLGIIWGRELGVSVEEHYRVTFGADVRDRVIQDNSWGRLLSLAEG